VGLATPPLSVSRLPTKCESLDVSKPYGPSRPLTGIALPFFGCVCAFGIMLIKTLEEQIYRIIYIYIYIYKTKKP
jgi:hypothetical protein